MRIYWAWCVVRATPTKCQSRCPAAVRIVSLFCERHRCTAPRDIHLYRAISHPVDDSFDWYRQTSSHSYSKFRFCVPVAIVHARSRYANTDVLAHAVHPAPSRKSARYVCTHINTRTWALERTREHRRARIHTLLITHSTQHRVTQHRVDNSPANPSHLLEIRR